MTTAPERIDNPAIVRLVHVTTAGQALGFLRGQVGYMKSRGVEVRAVTSPGGDATRFEAAEGVPVHTIDMPRRITPVRDLVALARMYRHFRRLRPHIVHAHTPKGGLLGTVAAWLARVPVRVYHIRGLPFMTATGSRRTLLRLTEKVACTLSKQVLCVSHSVREVAVHEGLCSPGKIVVLGNGSGNGVDALGRFNPGRWASVRECTRRAHGIPPEALVLGFVGRIVRDKGIVELTGAWTALRKEFEHLHLLFVGAFEPQDAVPDAVTDLLRADDRVHLTGPQDNPAPFYAAMDVVALPTYREGFPNVPLEAAAMGLPVVATMIPGCIDAVQNGVTGTLVPPRDVLALTRAIARYFREPELCEGHGRAGRGRVLRAFRPEAVWDAIHTEYVRLLDASGASGSPRGSRPETHTPLLGAAAPPSELG